MQDCSNTKNTKSTSSEKPKCELCHDLQMIEQEDGRYKFCECYTREQNEKRINRSGMRKSFIRYTFDNFIVGDKATSEAKKQAISYAEKTPAEGLIMTGRSGTGKTHLCTAICNRLIYHHGKEVLYTMYLDLIDEIKQYATEPTERVKAINKYKNIEILYIDDLYKKKRSDADIAIVYEIINHRNLNDKTTIITTEASLKELLSIDEATAGRIFEHCDKNIIKLETTNKRIYKTEKENE